MSHADRQQPEGPGPAGQIGVFLLDDHEIVRRGVRELLDPEAASRVMRRMRDQASHRLLHSARRPVLVVPRQPATAETAQHATATAAS
jgi:DNA-binding NarL/FixJ family response regulator